MNHLYALGHRRIGIITGPLVSPLSRDRLLGATGAAEGIKAEHDLLVTEGDFTIESGAHAAELLFGSSNPPTAIFCFNDEMAIGALGAARRRALRVPEDLSIVGFDDVRYAAHTNPPLTTIAQPMQQIGEHAVRLLLDLLNGRPDVPLSVTMPHRLVVRASTAAA